MKKILFTALIIIGLIFLNWKFHLYQRVFNPDEFYFVTREGTEFYLEGEPFRFVGVNTRLIHGDKERAMLAEALDSANDLGIRVIRQWAVGECENDSTAKHKPIEKYYFQAGPNNWVEESFIHFDSLLVEASKRDIKVMITLFNNWVYYGGMPMYLKWTDMSEDSVSARHDDFYTHPQIEKWVKGYIDKLVLRENSITGISYRDDPTIFSWELVNESNATPDNYQDMIDWTKRTAEYIKSLDPNHLVSTSITLVDNKIQRDHTLNTFKQEALDYVDLHAYPAEHWWHNFLLDEEHLNQLVDDYTQIAHFAVGKPLVIGEFGFKRGETWLDKERHELFATVFQRAYENGVSGIMPWTYSDPAWDDVYEINWVKPEHAQVCSVMAVYADKFADTKEPVVKNPNIGPQFGDSLRVHAREQTFEPVTLYPAFVSDSLVRYQIPIQAYSNVKWTSFGYWDGGEGYAFIYGKDHGYYTYPFYAAKAEQVSGMKIKARMSTDFPSVTDEVLPWFSDVTVSLNETEIATITVGPEKFFGTVYEIEINKDHGKQTLFKLNEGLNHIKFEVKESAENQHGLEIFGHATSEEYKKEETLIELEFIH